MWISFFRLLQKQNDVRGVTLLEVLIAMALVSLVLMALSGFATVAIKGASFGQKLTTAVTLAQDKLEEMQGQDGGYQSSLSQELTTTEPYGSLPNAQLFKRKVRIQGNDPVIGMQTVTVTVSWDSDKHSISVSTLFAE